jgi:hypothetical protein
VNDGRHRDGNVNEPDERVDYGEHGKAAKLTVGVAGFGLGNESTPAPATTS